MVALLLTLKADCTDSLEEEKKESPQTTLYEDLGGEAAIRAVVEGMYKKIFADPDLTEFFRKTNKDL